jgi:isoamylase
MHNRRDEPGHPLPLGAWLTGRGVQFNLFSRNAEAVSLLLFENPGDEEPAEIYQLDPEQNRTGDIWHIHIHGVKTGQLYLYRVAGPFKPEEGHRFDPEAWLIDPYTKALTHHRQWLDWKRELMPKCVVVNDYFDWQGDKPLNIPLKECIIYEAHLAGMSKSPSAGTSAPGTFKALIEIIPHLQSLGITSVELLPVQEFNPYEIIRRFPDTGERITNYWGYSTVAFFAPAAFYAASGCRGEQVSEFKEMVREMHKAGIEVILDIVFNHSAEGNEEGPTFSFRGLDNSIYYILEEDRRYYRNYSGCGNTLNCNHPIMRSFILACIRYWVMEMHVDGFRFDLGSILGRDGKGNLLDNPPVIERIAEDPIIRNTKLIAEAWDAAGAYQVGSFAGDRWAEWNDRYRDDIRRFWRGDEGMVSGFATRFSGSSDLYLHGGRKPFHSINYITSHDGFTLNDLVSYRDKHNETNGEDNRDGHNGNYSENYGIEGDSNDPAIKKLRSRMVMNFFASLLLSAGTPMLLGGDEFRRSQRGNNNAYCQDNEISWFNWSFAEKHKDILDFCREVIDFRRRHPVFRRSDFYSGMDNDLNGLPDITWFSERAKELRWDRKGNILAILIDGSKAETQAERDDNDFYLMFNATERQVRFRIASPPSGKMWRLKIDTAANDTAAKAPIMPKGKSEVLKNQKSYLLAPRSMVVLVSNSH